jgi:energy-converting hydrogenase Eha subunit C
MDTLVTILLIIGGAGFILYRQFSTQPITKRSLVIPAALAVVLATRYHDDAGVLSISVTAAAATVGLMMGFCTGFFARVWRDHVTGILYAKGGWAFVATLVVLIAIRIGLRVVLQASGLPISEAVLNDAFIAMGVGSYLGRVGVIALRALSLAGWDLTALDLPSTRRQRTQAAW